MVADVTERLMAEFEDRLELSLIARVVLGCRRDLACSPAAALPELIERLARQRLLDPVAARRSVVGRASRASGHDDLAARALPREGAVSR